MVTLMDLLLFFTIYSFLGWTLETIFASIRAKKIINRGFLTGFVCPIYGFSAMLIIQSSKSVANVFENQFALLIVNIFFSIIIVTILEYITGLFLERIFHHKWWNYSDNAFNFKGYICLNYSLIWGVLAFMLIHLVHPIISAEVTTIPISVKGYLGVIFFIYLLADIIKSVIKTLDLRKSILDYSNISINKHHEKIIKYERLFIAFPRLLLLNADTINHDIRRILNDRMDKIKIKLKNRFH